MKKLDVRRAITDRGYTVSSFAEKADIKLQNLIQNLINGNPSVKKLYFIAEQLGCDITDLFYEQDLSCPQGASSPVEGEEKSPSSAETAEQGKAEEQPVQTIAFCPHCGAKVRVGVVLLPE